MSRISKSDKSRCDSEEPLVYARLSVLCCLIGALLICLYLPACSGGNDGGVQKDNNLIGRLKGHIEFRELSPAVEAYLDSHSVEPSDAEAVKLYQLGGLSPSVEGAYLPAEPGAAPGSKRVAGYKIDAPVLEDGTVYLLVVRNIEFDSGAEYKFGSAVSTAPAVQTCPAALPLEEIPDEDESIDDSPGTDCSMSECAALVTVNLRVEGLASDLDVLPITASCEVAAQILEGGAISQQASTGPQDLPIADLRSPAGVQIRLLLRGDASSLRLDGSCRITIPPGEFGFPVDSGNVATFAAAVDGLSSPACGVDENFDLSIPIERFEPASLTGMFDVNGLSEAQASIRIKNEATGISDSETAPLFADGNIPTRGDFSGSYWRFDSVQPGNYTVQASALEEQGRCGFRLPYAAGLSLLQIGAGNDKDLDATFVAVATFACGQIGLWDPENRTQLASMNSNPLIGHIDFGRSYVEAKGDSNVVTGGRSGFGAASIAQYQGSFDISTGLGSFGYALILTGLSPEDEEAATDGSDMLPVAWNVTGTTLRWSGANRESLRLLFNRELRFTARSPADLAEESDPTAESPCAGLMDHSGGVEATVPRQDICFGEVRAHFHIDETVGTFYEPRLFFQESFLSSSDTYVAGVNYNVASGLATGPPETPAGATSPATVWAVLPEGIQHHLNPEVSFKAADGTLSTFDDLPVVEVPSAGTLGCSEIVGICLLFEGGGGDAAVVTVGLDPDLSTCVQDGSGSEYQVVVEPPGTPLDYVTVTIGSQTQTLCSSCVAGPGLSFDLSDPFWNLSPGNHDLQVLVGAGGCEASIEKNLVIFEQELQIECEADVDVFLSPGQSEVQESQIHDRLGATVSGGCGVTGVTEDDRPQVFPLGTSTVLFNHGEVSCQQNVNVLESSRQIAYADGDQVVVRRLEDGAIQYQVSLPSPQRHRLRPGGRAHGCPACGRRDHC